MRRVKCLFGGSMGGDICEKAYDELVKKSPNARIDRVEEGKWKGFILFTTDEKQVKELNALKMISTASFGMLKIKIDDLGSCDSVDE